MASSRESKVPVMPYAEWWGLYTLLYTNTYNVLFLPPSQFKGEVEFQTDTEDIFTQGWTELGITSDWRKEKRQEIFFFSLTDEEDTVTCLLASGKFLQFCILCTHWCVADCPKTSWLKAKIHSYFLSLLQRVRNLRSTFLAQIFPEFIRSWPE